MMFIDLYSTYSVLGYKKVCLTIINDSEGYLPDWHEFY